MTVSSPESWVVRRAAGEPLEYVVGWSEFRGLRFTVTEGVLVPRPRSGLLVEQAGSLVRCLSGPGHEVVVGDGRSGRRRPPRR